VAAAIVVAVVGLSGCAFGETTPATDVTETSATLHGNVRSNLEDQTVWWFTWGTTTAYGSETPHRTVAISGQGAHPVAETLTGLEPNTTYHYRLCAMDPAHQTSGACGGDKTVTTAPVGSYRDEVLADGPVGYWRLGESGATTAASETGTDSGIYMNGVTLGRPGAITGDPSTGAGLDGVDDTVRVPSSAALGPTAGISLEAWVDPAASTGTSTILRKDGQYLLRLTPSGNLIFRLWHGSTATELTTAPNLVQPGRYHHVVATWDGAEMTVYVNATRRGTLELSGPIVSGTSSLYLGASSGAYDWLKADIDEVAVYGEALSARRVAAHFAAADVPPTSPAVSLDSPADGSTFDDTPTYAGLAATEPGSSDTVTVNVYPGTEASGTPAQVVTAEVQPAGTFSVVGSPALPSGTYTAQAEQAGAPGTQAGLSPARTFAVDAGLPPTVLAAGDIAGCDTSGDEATAALLDRLPGTVVTLGDHAYEFNTASDFANCYDPTWGRHKARTRPGVGGHEYLTPGAAPYFSYFGAAAGDPDEGYYSFDLGSWHVVMLNPQCADVGGCGAGSPQEQWLRDDLQAHPTACTLAVVHEPRFSSGAVHGNHPEMQPFWQALYDHGAEVVLSGDDHLYERFAPQTPTGVEDTALGIRQFVVGTGGRSHYAFADIKPNSQAREANSFGVIRLSLRPGAYDWEFVPEAGQTFTDSGTTPCH
jgi:hypothetical protein